MEFDKFIRKSSDKYKHAHPFTAEDILDLPKAINAPIAVFVSTNGVDKVILTEIKKDGMNFIVTIKAVERKRKGGVILEVNEIETLYPKKSRGIISWINKKLASNIDKEKALAWVEALRTNRETELTEQELISATNIIQNFENPNIEPRNSLKSLDAPYLDAVARGDMATAEKEDIRYSLREATGEKLTPAMIRHHMMENITRHHEQEVNRINRFYDREIRKAEQPINLQLTQKSFAIYHETCMATFAYFTPFIVSSNTEIEATALNSDKLCVSSNLCTHRRRLYMRSRYSRTDRCRTLGQMLRHAQHSRILHQSHHCRCGKDLHITRAESQGRICF